MSEIPRLGKEKEQISSKRQCYLSGSLKLSLATFSRVHIELKREGGVRRGK